MSLFSSYLKISWVKRYLSNPTGLWQKIIGLELGKYGGKRVFNFQEDKLRYVSEKIKNPFWKDTLRGLKDTRQDTKMEMSEVLSMDILNFVHEDNLSYFLRWNSYGIENLCDLLNEDKSDFLSFEEVRQKCHCNYFTKYYSLLSNIPTSFKKIIKANLTSFDFSRFIPKDVFTERLLSNRCLKFVYNILVHKKVEQPDSKFFAWKQLLDCEIDDWQIYFDIVKRCCRDPYLRNFQYKFLHRIVPTNVFLYKIRLKDTKLCTFCKSCDETVEHLFYDCPVTKNFLKQFFDQLKLYYSNIELDKKHFLLGFSEESLLLNLLVIIAKQYIFKCKLDEKKPNLTELRGKIKKYMSTEFYIGKKMIYLIK